MSVDFDYRTNSGQKVMFCLIQLRSQVLSSRGRESLRARMCQKLIRGCLTPYGFRNVPNRDLENPKWDCWVNGL